MNSLFAALLMLASRSNVLHPQSPGTAARVGLTAEVLAASGYSTSAAQAVLGNLDAASTARAALTSAEAALDGAIAQLGSLNTQIDETGDPELVTARTTLEESLPALRTAIEGACAALVNAALDGTNTDAATRARTALGNARAKIPVTMKVVSLSAQEADALAIALLAEGVQQRDATAADDGFSAPSLVQQFRSRSEVAQAQSDLGANGAGVAEMFAGWQ